MFAIQRPSGNTVLLTLAIMARWHRSHALPHRSVSHAKCSGSVMGPCYWPASHRRRRRLNRSVAGSALLGRPLGSSGQWPRVGSAILAHRPGPAPSGHCPAQGRAFLTMRQGAPRQRTQQPCADPGDARYGHRVADGLVARSIRCGLAAVGHQRVIVRHALQPLALARHKPPHAPAHAPTAGAGRLAHKVVFLGRGLQHHGTALTRLPSASGERARDLPMAALPAQLVVGFLRERYRWDDTAVSMAGFVGPRPQGRAPPSERVGAVPLRSEGDDGYTLARAVLAAPLAPVRGVQSVADRAGHRLDQYGFGRESNRGGAPIRHAASSVGSRPLPNPTEKRTGPYGDFSPDLPPAVAAQVPTTEEALSRGVLPGAGCRGRPSRSKSTSAGSRSLRPLATRNTRLRRWARPKYWASSTRQATRRRGAHTTSVRPPLPWRLESTAFAGQCAQQAAEGIAPVAEHAGDVLPDDRRGREVCAGTDLVDGIGDLHIGKGERTTRIGKPLAGSRGAERLARRAADQDGRCSNLSRSNAARQQRHVAEVGYLREAMRENGAREGIRFGEPGRSEAERLPREADGLDAAADAAVIDGLGVGVCGFHGVLLGVGGGRQEEGAEDRGGSPAGEEVATRGTHRTQVGVRTPCSAYHPARVVAGAEIPWHASAHKGSPLLHRWAPARTAVDPTGLRAARAVRRAPGDPSATEKRDQYGAAAAACGRMGLPPAGMAVPAGTLRRRRGMLGPRGARGGRTCGAVGVFGVGRRD